MEPVTSPRQRLAEAERAFFGSTYLAPVTPGARVRVRAGGITRSMTVIPAEFAGWALLQPVGAAHARALRVAEGELVQRYLSLLPVVTVTVTEQREEVWYGAEASDPSALAPVLLAPELRPGDRVKARWDGSQYLFEERAASGGRTATPPVASPAGGRMEAPVLTGVRLHEDGVLDLSSVPFPAFTVPEAAVLEPEPERCWLDELPDEIYQEIEPVAAFASGRGW